MMEVRQLLIQTVVWVTARVKFRLPPNTKGAPCSPHDGAGAPACLSVDRPIVDQTNMAPGAHREVRTTYGLMIIRAMKKVQ